MFYLRDPNTDDFYEIGPTTTVGRFSGDISFPEDTQISKKHCLIEVFEGALRITDLGSTNGTFVGDKILECNIPQILSPGDLVTIGRQVLTVGILETDSDSQISKAEDEKSRTVTDIDVSAIDDEISDSLSNDKTDDDSGSKDISDEGEKDEASVEAKTKKPKKYKLTAEQVIFGFIALWTLIGIIFSGSMQFGLKYSPIIMWVAEIVGFAACVGALHFPILKLFSGKKLPPLPQLVLGILIALCIQVQVSSLTSTLLGNELKKKVNLIYSSCIIKKNSKQCETQISDCQICMRKFNEKETDFIQQLLTQAFKE